ncbi:hypothetical protein D9M69_633940 [compost metagenome]
MMAAGQLHQVCTFKLRCRTGGIVFFFAINADNTIKRDGGDSRHYVLIAIHAKPAFNRNLKCRGGFNAEKSDHLRAVLKRRIKIFPCKGECVRSEGIAENGHGQFARWIGFFDHCRCVTSDFFWRALGPEIAQ